MKCQLVSAPSFHADYLCLDFSTSIFLGKKVLHQIDMEKEYNKPVKFGNLRMKSLAFFVILIFGLSLSMSYALLDRDEQR